MSTLSQRQFGSSVAWNFNAEATYDGGDGAKENVAIDSMYALGDDYFQNIEEQQDGLHGYSHVHDKNASLDTSFPWASPNGLNAGHCWPIEHDQSARNATVDGRVPALPSLMVGPLAESQAEVYGVYDTFSHEMQGTSNQLVNGAVSTLHLPPTLIPSVTTETAVFDRDEAKPAMAGWGLSGVVNGSYSPYTNFFLGAPSVSHPEYTNTQGSSTGPPPLLGHYHWSESEVPISFELRKRNSCSSNEPSAPLDSQIQHIAFSAHRFSLPDGSTLLKTGYQMLPRCTANSGDISVSPEISEIQNLRKDTNAEEPALSPAAVDAPAPQSIHTTDDLGGKTACEPTGAVPSSSNSKTKAAAPKKKREIRKTRSPAGKKYVDPKAVLPIFPKASKKTASLECKARGCGKKFSHKRSLQKHEELHERTLETQPECPNCKEKLSRHDALVRHVKNLYETDPENECVRMAQQLGWRYKVRGTGKKLLKGLGQR